MASIRALTNEASGWLVYETDPKKALDFFHLSRQLWTSVDSHINATRLRLQLAELQLRLGDKTGAVYEIRAAITSAKDHGAKKLAEARDGTSAVRREMRCVKSSNVPSLAPNDPFVSFQIVMDPTLVHREEHSNSRGSVWVHRLTTWNGSRQCYSACWCLLRLIVAFHAIRLSVRVKKKNERGAASSFAEA